jgi:hypothetical protein
MLDGQRRRRTTGERHQLRARECRKIIMPRVRVQQYHDLEPPKTTMLVRNPHPNLVLRRMLLRSEAKRRHVRELRKTTLRSEAQRRHVRELRKTTLRNEAKRLRAPELRKTIRHPGVRRTM